MRAVATKVSLCRMSFTELKLMKMKGLGSQGLVAEKLDRLILNVPISRKPVLTTSAEPFIDCQRFQ